MKYVTLNNNVKMPILGFGAYIENVEDSERIIREAIEIGYRHFDTAQLYKNEEALGRALSESNIAREDFIANKDAKSFAIALDPSGKLAWKSSIVGDEYEERRGDHIVTILSENVTDAYLAYLQSIGVSYIFAGKTRNLDVKLLLDKLNKYFNLEIFYLLGGGIINGFFAQAEVIDEISLIMAPLIEGNNESKSLFHFTGEHYDVVSNYEVVDMKKLDSGSLHITYRKK